MPVEERRRVVSLVVLELGMNRVAWRLSVARLGSSFFPCGHCCTWPSFFFRLVHCSCYTCRLAPVAGKILARLNDPGDWVHWVHCLGRYGKGRYSAKISGRGRKAGLVGAQSRSCYSLAVLIRHAYFGKRVLCQPLLSAAPHRDNKS